MEWMKPKVYVETTIVSYLTAQASRDLVVAAHQKVTREWWERRRRRFDLYGMDYLLTWNCKHIANAEMRNAVGAVCGSHGCGPPVICTPEELMGG